jgi:CBS domain-containing protein
VSSLPIVNATHQVVGVVSEADLLARVAGELGRAPGVHRFAGPGDQHQAAHGSTARELMTAPAVTVGMLTPIAEAVRLAAKAKVRRMPVVDQHGRLVGVVTRGDLLRPFLRNDADIDEEIRGFLRRGMKLTDPTVGVSVCEGVVTLTGELDRQLTVRRLIDHVSAISGVIEVRNRLSTRINDTVVPFAWGPRPVRRPVRLTAQAGRRAPSGFGREPAFFDRAPAFFGWASGFFGHPVSAAASSSRLACSAGTGREK